ncbi:hypothetical protein [Streptomyces sp. NPDC056600]|uniref:hypothetical protein n=1 Tax=Streptomyces sp. NPDC056600 TaxID=3345874 RepID=UPI0036B22650
MPSLTYQDLHAAHAGAIEAEVTAALEAAGPPGGLLRTACEELLDRQPMRYPLSVLPLAVHGAETGDPEPALPLAAVHLLWWTAACRMDDVADGESAAGEGASGPETSLSTLALGTLLPLRLLGSPRLPGPSQQSLAAELISCGLAAVGGQLADLRGASGIAPRRGAVLAAYRGKSGAPFAMITGMAALLAGASPERTAAWREFGDLLGILWQFFNDQEDIASGRNEDLANGTATHLLACAAESASLAEAARLGLLRQAARTSPRAREELLGMLLRDEALELFRQDVERHRVLAHQVLGRLGGREPYASCLRDLVDQAARPSLPAPVPAR